MVPKTPSSSVRPADHPGWMGPLELYAGGLQGKPSEDPSVQ